MAAGAVAARRPPERQQSAQRSSQRHSRWPIKFFRQCAILMAERRLHLSELLVVTIIGEIQVERMLNEEAEPDAPVPVSAAELAKLTGQDQRTMELALSRLNAAGVLPRSGGGPGRRYRYGLNYEALANLEAHEAPAAKPTKRKQLAADPLPVHLDCPLGKDCPVESVVERGDGILVNISPPRFVDNKGVLGLTSGVHTGGEQKAKGPRLVRPAELAISGEVAAPPAADGRQAMVQWFHQTLPFDQVGEWMAPAMEAQLWRHVQRCDAKVWQGAVIALLRRVEAKKLKYLSWALVLMAVLQAATGAKRHRPGVAEAAARGAPGGGSPASTRAAEAAAAAKCATCGERAVFEGRCRACGRRQ